MLSVLFSYNHQQDAANLLRGLQSVNNPRPSRIEASYLRYVNGHVSNHTALMFVQHYLVTNGISIDTATMRISSAWEQVRKPFLSRVREIFKCEYPLPSIQAYLTIDTRCTYSIIRNTFHVSINSRDPALQVMHELFHFYTWHALNIFSFTDILSCAQYNDLKEALTELLNVEFSDLMLGSRDKGYEQHRKLRRLVRLLWTRHQDFYALIRDPELKKAIK